MEPQYETNLIYRKMDSSGDYVFGGCLDDFLTGQAAMRQALQTRLRAERGDWWEGDPTAIAYTEEVLGQPCTEENRQRIDLLIADRVLDTVCVTGIVNQQSSYNGRQYRCQLSVNTLYGQIETAVET